jgi:hypothetical protein
MPLSNRIVSISLFIITINLRRFQKSAIPLQLYIFILAASGQTRQLTGKKNMRYRPKYFCELEAPYLALFGG